MKTWKRIASVVLMMMMLVTMILPVWGDEPVTPTYTIKIKNAVEDETYTAYKIFDAVWASAATDETKVAYTIENTSVWFDVILDYMVDDEVVGETIPKKYATADADGNYTGKGLTFQKTATSGLYNVIADTTNTNTSLRYNAADFAKFLIANKPKNATTAATATAAIPTGETAVSATLTITGDDPEGYYLVDSTLGILCALDTLNTTVEVQEKNTIPSITKKVKAADESAYADYTTAYFGQAVNYQLTVNTGTVTLVPSEELGTGVDSDYTITDTLPKEIVVDGTNYNLTVSTPNGKTTDTWKADTATVTNDYKVEIKDATETSGQQIVITLHSSKLKDLAKDTNITITYTATMNTQTTGEYNNEVELKYKNQTMKDHAHVACGQIDIYKYHTVEKETEINGGTSTYTAKEPLAGAEFILYYKDGTKTYYYKEVKTGTPAAVTSYEWTETKSEATSKISDSDGKVVFNGLDAKGDDIPYYIEEIAAPAGYNLLAEAQEVYLRRTSDDTTTDDTCDGEVNLYTKKVDNDKTEWIKVGNNGFEIENNSGTELPSTGGVGTTIFYCAGAVLALGAFVLLITRKRMQKQ